MRSLRLLPLRLLLATLMTFAPAAWAGARCGGKDLMAELARTDPEVHAGILARGAAQPNARGIFWRVEAPGVPASHLYGTVHSTEAAGRPLRAGAQAALNAARVVLVELAPDEQARLQQAIAREPGFIMDPDGPVLSERLGPEAMKLARSALESRGLAIAMAERLQPWLILSMLSVPRCEQEAIAAGAPVLDQMIADRALKGGTPVLSLESFRESFAAFDGLTEAEMTALLVDAVATVPVEEDLRRTLEVLYERGEIAAILEFSIWHSERTGLVADSRGTAESLGRSLMFARNRAWMKVLVPEIEKGGAFAAFGALHLPGAQGVVELLRARGFSVRRLDG